MQRGRYIPVHKCLSEILVKNIDAGLLLFSHSELLIRFLFPFNVLQRE